MLPQLADWEKSRQRFEAWWQGKVVDRVLIQVTAPKKGRPEASAPKYRNVREKYLDTQYRISEFEYEFSRTHYAGDAFPCFTTSLGPGTLATYLGSEPEFTERTVWYHKCVQDIPGSQPPVYEEGNPYWQATLQLCRTGVRKLTGQALVGYPDLIENLDTLASLFGTEELLVALKDYPEEVHRFQKALVPLYLKYHQHLYEIIKDEHGGSCFSHFAVYGQGKVAKLQCDFSAMISPKMFEEFVAPYLAQQCRGLEHTVYHWDGPCALQHEKALLAIKELQAIQWTPGAGNPEIGDRVWWPMYKRVRQAGKSLLLFVGPAEAKALVEEFGPEGLNLVVSCQNEEEAEALVRQSLAWKKK